MNRLLELALAPKLGLLVRAACCCTMASLLVMVLIVTVPIPLLLVLGMGLAHGLGLLGILLYAIAVLREAFVAEGERRKLEQLVQDYSEKLNGPPASPPPSE